MKIFFGVNSNIPLNSKTKNGYTIYDWVVRKKGIPAFCFRTLCGENSTTREEIDYLKKKNCRMGMVIRDLKELDISSSHGDKDAFKAIRELKRLDLNSNKRIAIFADINPNWSINHNWMITFAQTLVVNGYIPAFIANTDSSQSCSFDRQCSHFANATRDTSCFGTIFCATEPKTPNKPETWSPFCPSALETSEIALWMCGKTEIDNTFVDDVYLNNPASIDKML